VLIVSCKDEPTAPEETTSTEQALAEKTIGPEGGTLETETFKLKVPAGSFSQSTQLKLFANKKTSTNSNSVTDAFRLEGVPQNYSQPVEVSIKYSGTLNGNNFVKCRMLAEVEYIDSTAIDTVNILYDAVENNGFLKTSIQPDESTEKNNFGKINDEAIPLTFEGFTNCALNSSEHFIIKSTDLDLDEFGPEIQLILQYFESAYSRFNTLGFDLSLTNWKKAIVIDIDYRIPHEDPPTLGFVKIYSSFKIWSNYDLNIAGQLYLCPSFVGLAILYAYDIEEAHAWISYAIANWSKLNYNYWTEHSDYSEIQTAIKYCLRNEGYFSIILDHLTQTYGEVILKNIMFLVKNGMESYQAIVSQTAAPKFWLTDLFESFVSGQIWLNRLKHHNPNASLIDVWNYNLSAQFGIDDTTTQITYTETYKDLSAKLYKIALLPSLKQGSTLKLSAIGGDTKISVFKYKNNVVEFITRSENEITIDNVKDLQSNGYNLFVMLTNHMPNYPYSTTSNITFKIKHNAEPVTPKVTACNIALKNIEVNIIIHYPSGDVPSTRSHIMNFYSRTDPAPTFANNIFYQAYSYWENDSTQYSGNTSIQFTDGLDSILTFSTQSKVSVTSNNPLYSYVIESSMSGHDLVVDQYDKTLFKVTGLDVCNKLNNNLTYSQAGQAISNWEIVSIDQCIQQTSLEIKITK
jgi:hypothetical protein